MKNDYTYLKQHFETAKGAVDLYIFFFEKGIHILKKNGSLAFITPNRYLSASYGQALREFIYKHATLCSIIDYSDIKVFSNASTYPILTFISKSSRENCNVAIGKAKALAGALTFKKVMYEKLNLLDSYLWGFLLNEKITITEKVLYQSIPLTKVCKINATSTASEADEYHSLINECNGYRLINTGTIDRYYTTWGHVLMTDKGCKFLKPYLPRNSAKISKNRHDLYSSPKIILAKIALRTEAFFDENGTYASINTNCLHSFSKDISPKYVLAWVNSKLFQYIFECFFEGLKMQGGYLLYSAPNLSATYIKITKKEANTINALVDNIINAKLTNLEADTSQYEKQIDRIFYSLYNLTDDEIAIVEGS